MPKAGLLSGTQTSWTYMQLPEFQTHQHLVGCVKDYDRASDIGYFVAPSHLEDQYNHFIRLYAVVPPATSASDNPPQRGDYVTLTVLGAEPGTTVKWYYSYDGCTDTTQIVPMGSTLDIANAVYLAQTTADSNGTAVKNFTIPDDFPLGDVWIQATEYDNTSEVIATEVVE